MENNPPPNYFESDSIMPPQRWDDQFQSGMQKAVKTIVEDEFVEQKMVEYPIWAVGTKSAKLTFLSQNEVAIFESHFESMACMYLMAQPPCIIDDDMIQTLSQMRMVGRFNLRRSSGTENSNKLNERTSLIMQIKQSISNQSEYGGGGEKQGFFKRLFGMG